LDLAIHEIWKDYYMWALYLASFSQTTIAQSIWDVIKVSPSLTLSAQKPIEMGGGVKIQEALLSYTSVT